LQCIDGTIAPYTGPTLAKIHLSLGITLDAFNTFIAVLISVAKANGVSPTDLNTIMALLQSTQNQIVATLAPVPVAPFPPFQTCPLGFQQGLVKCGNTEQGRLGNFLRSSKLFTCPFTPACSCCVPYFFDTSNIRC